MRTRINTISVIILAFMLNSCSKFIPGKFWENYETEKIVQKTSDHGPFGGTAKIIWEGNEIKLNSKDFLKNAEKNKWKLVDSVNIENGKVASAKNDFTMEILNENNIIKMNFQNSKVYIFTTNMITVNPSNNETTEKNGFLIMNESKSKILMYNRWGE